MCDTKGAKVKGTEIESDSEREEETDAEISLVWTDCTHFHLSPSSWIYFFWFLLRADKWKQRRGRQWQQHSGGPDVRPRSDCKGIFICEALLTCHTVTWSKFNYFSSKLEMMLQMLGFCLPVCCIEIKAITLFCTSDHTGPPDALTSSQGLLWHMQFIIQG